jgi:hypothetical protein
MSRLKSISLLMAVALVSYVVATVASDSGRDQYRHAFDHGGFHGMLFADEEQGPRDRNANPRADGPPREPDAPPRDAEQRERPGAERPRPPQGHEPPGPPHGHGPPHHSHEHGPPHPPGHGPHPPIPPELRKTAERIEHLHHAIEHLRQAGLNDVAENLQAKSSEMERNLHRELEAHAREHGPMHEIHGVLRDLREEVGRLRNEVQELRESLPNRPAGDRKPD